MGQVTIQRDSGRVFSWTLGTATAAATTIRMEGMAGGCISVGTMLTASSTLQVFGSVAEAGPFRRLYSDGGAAADVTLAPSTTDGRMYSLPDPIFAVPFIKIVSGATNSTGVSAVVSLKS